MPSTNPKASYGAATKVFHWLTALLILTAFPLGILASDAAFGTGAEVANKAWLFSLHKTVGVTAFLTALARILWALTHVKPNPLHPDRKLETFAAEAVHWLLYISMLMVPLSGWLHHAASSGFAPILWPPVLSQLGQSLPLVPKSEAVSAFFAGGHFVFTKLLMVSIGLHIAGALKHVVIDRDQTLRRMLPGKAAIQPAPVAPPAPAHSKTPMLAAMAIYAVAITFGAWIGLSHPAARDLTQLKAVNSGWRVSDGTLAISVSQFGNDVTGNFSDWTAAIDFDPETGTGHVEVTINIASLTLGSLSDQALGHDFFDAETHPTAVFSADITATDASYTATGTLTIKDTARPTSLPFSLEINEDTAVMQAVMTLNRLDFNIGANMPEEDSLKHPVQVSIALTAHRSAP